MARLALNLTEPAAPDPRRRRPGQDGPRLDDLRVAGSEYGAPIPLSVGTVRLAGQMIWATELEEREIRHTDTSAARVAGGGGKGKGGKKGTGLSDASAVGAWTEYRYYANFAVAFSAGPAHELLKLWADGNLIFDRTGVKESTHSLRLAFRFYPGSEAQQPDALIENSVEGGQAPAHRGLVYIVFEAFELTDFGNRIPSITAEIAFEPTAARPYKTPTWINASSTHTQGIRLDPERGLLYSADGAGVRVFNAATLEETDYIPPEALTRPDGSPSTARRVDAIGAGGILYIKTNEGWVLKVDAIANRVVGAINLPGDMGATCVVQVPNILAGQLDEYLIVEKWLGIGVWIVPPAFDTDLVDLNPAGIGKNVYGPTPVPGAVHPWGSTFYWGTATNGGSEGSIFKGTLYADPGAAVRAEAVEIVRLGTGYLTGFLGAGAPVESGAAHALVYDPADHSLIFYLTGYWTKFSEDLGVVWAVEGAYPSGQRIRQNTLTRNEFVAYLNAADHRVHIRSTVDGSLVRNESGWDPDGFRLGGVRGDIIMDGESNTIYTCDNDGPAKVYLGRANRVSSALGSAVAAIAARAGLTGDRIDVSALTGDVPGYSIADPDLTVRDILEPMMAAWRFDAVESDFTVRFVPLTDRAPVMGLSVSEEASDLLWLDEREGLFLEERRANETELPQTVSVSHYDPDRDYLKGEQHAQRPLFPTLSVQSENRLRIDLPLAITAEKALAAAWHILLDAWIGRSTYTFRTDHGVLALDPLDVVQITLEGRGRALVRITSVELSDGLALEFAARAVVAPTCQTVFDADGDGLAPDVLSEAPPVLIAPASADGGSGLLQSEVPNRLSDPGSTWLFLLDCPLLSDLHAVSRRSVLYYAGVPANPSRPWGSATVGFTRDGETYHRFGRLSAACGYGTLTEPLGAPHDPFVTDRDNTITVRMQTRDEALESVSMPAMLNGANMAAILTNDGAEIVQYQTVTENDDGTLSLSTLLRGRRGTEVFCGGHTAGARLILLDSGWLNTGLMALDDLGATLSWAAVSDGQSVLTVPVRGHVHRGRDLSPYAPVHLKAVLDGAVITLSWVRRTRLTGAWRDGVGTVPLSEASEAYEVEILDGPGGAVVRTFTDLTSPTVDYDTATAVTDLRQGGDWQAFTVTNPGAEDGGSSVGWTDRTLTFVQASGGVTGGSSFAPQGNDALAEATQDFAVPVAMEASADAGLLEARVVWWQKGTVVGANTPEANVHLEVLDGGGSVLETATSDWATITSWTERELIAVCPVGVRSVSVVIRGDGYARIDDVALFLRELDASPGTLTFRVYQMSDVVGRGFPGEANVTVETA